MSAALPQFRQVCKPEQLLGPLNPIEARNAPALLYVAGWLSWLERGARVAIVGSRRASPEGLKRTVKLARILIERDVLVVSGLADGIDTAAHLTAIERGGKTVAVLGTPLDVVYPPKNRALQATIMEHHLAISQFREGTPVQKSNFPRRNRTMALIADASVIVEAGETSGALSQGWEALRLGRPLYIMRSVAEDSRLTWPDKMQQYGARVLDDRDLDSLFELLPARIGDPVAGVSF